MKNKAFYSSFLSLSIAAVLVGCGGGGSSSGSTPVNKEGRAIDGPLAGALVVFKDCMNATTKNPETAETDANGFFKFPTNCSSSTIHVSGGLDRTSNLPFSDVLIAPRSTSTQVIVSPITTLIQMQVEQGQNVNAAAQQIARALGLQGTQLLSADPMQNQDLYVKTAVVQQLVEQIKNSIAPLGDSIPEEEFTLATFAALSTALNNRNNVLSLQDQALIEATLSQTLSSIQEHLEPEYRSDLAAVSANLSALAIPLIQNNIADVEETLQNLSPTTFAQGVDAIQQATQDNIQAAKESNTTHKVVTNLAESLTLPADEAATVLAEISDAILSADPSTNISSHFEQLLDLIEVYQPESSINPELVLDNLISAPDFYRDYIKLAQINVMDQSYAADALINSLQQPIDLNQLNGISLDLHSYGAQRGQNLQVSAGLKINTLSKSLVLAIDQLNLSFDTNGVLTRAVLPQGAELALASNLSSVTNTELTLSRDINVLQNGKIALNAAVLSQIAPQLAGLANLPLGGETVTVTGVIEHPDAVVAYDHRNAPVLALRYQLDQSVYGAGLTGKFKIAP